MLVCKRKRDWIENFMPSWKVVGKGRNKIPCTAFHHIVYIKAVYCNCFYFNFFFCFIEYKKKNYLKKKSKQCTPPPFLIIYRHRWSYYGIKFLTQKRHLQAISLLKYWDKIWGFPKWRSTLMLNFRHDNISHARCLLYLK